MKKVELEISMLKDKKDKVQTTNCKMSSFICIMDHWSAHLCHARHYNECVLLPILVLNGWILNYYEEFFHCTKAHQKSSPVDSLRHNNYY